MQKSLILTSLVAFVMMTAFTGAHAADKPNILVNAHGQAT